MKKNCIVILLVVLPNIVFAKEQFSKIGLIMANNFCHMQQNFGGEIFTHKPTQQISIFIGHSFSPLLDFELGFTHSLDKMYSVYVPAATKQFGIPNFTTIASSVYNTKKTYHGYNLLYVPQIKLSNYFNIAPMMGILYLHLSADLFLVEFDEAPATIQEQTEYNIHFASSKLIYQLGIRLQYTPHKNFAIFFNYLWNETNKFAPASTRRIFPNQTLLLELQNSSSIGVGILYKLFW